MIFVEDSTTSLTSSKPPVSSSTNVTLPQLFSSAAVKKNSETYIVLNISSTNQDKMELTSTDFSLSKLVSREPSTITPSVHVISSFRHSYSFVTTTTTTSSPYSFTTSVFTTNSSPMNSHGQTNKKSFFDESYNLFLVTSVCGGVASLTVLSALISVIYKRACTGSGSSLRYVPF